MKTCECRCLMVHNDTMEFCEKVARWVLTVSVKGAQGDPVAIMICAACAEETKRVTNLKVHRAVHM